MSTLALLAAVLALPGGAAAGPGKANGARNAVKAHVPAPLLEAAKASPQKLFDVIVQGTEDRSTQEIAAAVQAEREGEGTIPPKRRFRSIAGVSVKLSGQELVRLARKRGIFAITPNARVQLSGQSNRQKWPYVVGAAKFWDGSPSLGGRTPAIAIVDSGIAPQADFGNRIIESVTIGAPGANSPGDGRGHGTFVASIAAGSKENYGGAAPTAPLVSVDVVDDAGNCMTADVIRAADWILANKDRLGIRVANFSLHATNPSTFMFDPLDRAVERLWFSGVVVVAAAGNYRVAGQNRGVPFAPANDPFVITVGASDIDGSIGTYDDFDAPWSAYGYTLDGFAKPELGAPGRYMIGAVPGTATLALERPDRVVSPGYMQLSGTSFAAPVVSGAAATLLALHPEWTPDQVKGALMMTVKAAPEAAPYSLGVGEVNLARAANVSNPPNPNLALRQFLVADPEGGSVPVFDAASWTSAAQSNASWTSASWTSASWTSASWTSASWTSASWTSASWTSASWTSASWTSASWTSASWTSTSQTDASWLSNAGDDALTEGGYFMTAEEIVASELELGEDLNADGTIGPVTVAAGVSTSVSGSSGSSGTGTGLPSAPTTPIGP